ncbi:MAG: hypothetical protein ABSA16_13995 [Thermoguttaceae bacterium]|jgi:hypothetical protein
MNFIQLNLTSKVSYILIPLAAIILLVFNGATPVHAGYLTVYGGPTNDSFPMAEGQSRAYFVKAVNNSGTAVGYTELSDSPDNGGPIVETRAVRWDGSVAAAVELGNLGTLMGE